MKVEYSPPWWLVVLEAIVFLTILIVGIISMFIENFSVAQIGFSLNIWLVVGGAVGLFYALFVFVAMLLICFCSCWLVGLVGILFILICARVVFYVAWSAVGILFLAYGGSNLVNNCPLTFAFTIVAIFAFLLDLISAWKFSKIE